MKRKTNDIIIFAELLKNTEIKNQLNFGKFLLKCENIKSSNTDFNSQDLLENKHEYVLKIRSGNLKISLQLYVNDFKHSRLFCFTEINSKKGLTFSVNLTTSKESKNVIFLTQKIKFAERYKGNEELASAHRRQKQFILCEILRKLDFEITENNDVILGIFDPTQNKLLNTTIEKFINDFIVIAILKGHFQGNKGYDLELLPNYNKENEILEYNDDELKNLPIKTIENKTKRDIPSGIRYKILNRDNFLCVKCGRGVKNGIKLQVDHMQPFSTGGLTEIKNLQTLCNECNIGKSNKYIDKN